MHTTSIMLRRIISAHSTSKIVNYHYYCLMNISNLVNETQHNMLLGKDIPLTPLIIPQNDLHSKEVSD